MRYYKETADKAVKFITSLTFTIGRWKGMPFRFIPWQEDLVRRAFGTLRDDSPFRQYGIVYCEVPKKSGKTELGGAITNKLLLADGEKSGIIYGCAGDRKQATLVYDVTAQMIRQSPRLSRATKIIESKKRITAPGSGSYYEAVSAEAYTKHGPSLSGVIFDELHTQPDRRLWDVMTVGSGDAREQQLIVVFTTAGTDRHSICWEVRQRAIRALKDPESDPTMLPIIYGAPDEADWEDRKVWIACNPSVITPKNPNGIIRMEKLEEAYVVAKQSPANENPFRRLRLNQWVRQESRWIAMADWDACGDAIDMPSLEGRDCYAGLDMASTTDLAALVLVFPPKEEGGKFDILSYFWIPEAAIDLRTRRDHVPYEYWEKEGLVFSTPGRVIDPRHIREHVIELHKLYNIKEIAFDRWGATQITLELEGEGFVMVPFGQGYASMSPACKEMERVIINGELRHGGNKVMRWMCDNAMVTQDPAANIKMDKGKSTEKIDGMIALVMALDRAIRHQEDEPSVYASRGVLTL